MKNGESRQGGGGDGGRREILRSNYCGAFSTVAAGALMTTVCPVIGAIIIACGLGWLAAIWIVSR